jgi:hypothetical protein
MRPVAALPLPLVVFACFMGTPTEIDPDAEREVFTEIRLLWGSGWLNSLGQSLAVQATPLNQWGFPFTGGTVELEWTSSDPDVAVVAGDGRDGLVTSVGNGVATILVRSGDVSREFEVMVLQLPYRVTVTPSIAQLFLDPPYHLTGPPVQLVATVTDREGQPCDRSICNVTWSSGDPGIAGIDTAGVAWPRASGSTEIHVVVSGPCPFGYCSSDLADTVSVNVSPRQEVGSDPVSLDELSSIEEGVPASLASEARRVGPPPLPMKGTTEGLLLGMDLPPPDRCPPQRPMLATYRGMGNATHMGRITVEGTECLFMDPSDPSTASSGEGRFVLTAANGDQLHVTYDQTVISFEPPPSPWVLWTTAVEAAGGTGRFEDAELEGVVWWGGVNLLTSETWSRLDGKIRLR